MVPVSPGALFRQDPLDSHDNFLESHGGCYRKAAAVIRVTVAPWLVCKGDEVKSSPGRGTSSVADLAYVLLGVRFRECNVTVLDHIAAGVCIFFQEPLKDPGARLVSKSALL